MNKVQDVILKPLEKSLYLKLFMMHFTQNGRKRTWELLKIHDSVAILIHNIQGNTLVLVRQFRPLVYLGNIPEQDRKGYIDVRKYPPELGVTVELCAGLVDKEQSLVQIAKEEVLEECGYDVPLDSFVQIVSCRPGVMRVGGLLTIYYCEVRDEMKVSRGGGTGDECIEVIEMSVPEVVEYVERRRILSPSSLVFAVYWFLCNKMK